MKNLSVDFNAIKSFCISKCLRIWYIDFLLQLSPSHPQLCSNLSQCGYCHSYLDEPSLAGYTCMSLGEIFLHVIVSDYGCGVKQ